MKILTIGVVQAEVANAQAGIAHRTESQGDVVLFASVDLLWRALPPRRWALIRAMAGLAPMSLRTISRLVAKDLKTVHGDVHALLDVGILARNEQGFSFPYDAVRVDFMLYVGGA